MDPTLVPGTRFESQFHICVYEHAILRIYIIIIPTEDNPLSTSYDIRKENSSSS